MASNKSCGQHTEIVSNAATRITRCTCGTFHVTFLGSGVTMRLSAEAVRGLASGLKAAVERLDEPNAIGGGATIN